MTSVLLWSVNPYAARDGHVRQDSWAQVRDPVSGDVWYNALPPYLSESPASNYASLVTGMRPKFYDNRVFHCPTARFPPGVRIDNDAFFSLAMNSKLILSPVQNPQCSIRFSTVQRPLDTVIFEDARVYKRESKVDVLQLDPDVGQSSASASRFAARHGQGGNLVFGDGNVRWLPGRLVVETRPGYERGRAIYPDGEVIWCADPLDNPNVSD